MLTNYLQTLIRAVLLYPILHAHVKYLGSICDANLNWKAHHELSKQISSGIGVLSKIKYENY